MTLCKDHIAAHEELKVRIEVPACLQLLRPLDSFVRQLVKEIPQLSGDGRIADDLELVFNEAFMNIHDHAYGPGVNGPVTIEITVGAQRLELKFEDEGKSFDPDRINVLEPGHEGERGRGLWLMRKVMDEYIYRGNQQGRNILRLVKRLPSP